MRRLETQRIIEKMEQIVRAAGDYSGIHEEQKAKRLAWWGENKEKILSRLSGLSPVRQAYQMVLFEYMGLDPEDVPVVYEDARKIVWRSFNFCPVLEACKELGMDTREVCKGGYEESVQDLVSQLNPRLRFSRNYENLRPHGEYCEETIEF